MRKGMPRWCKEVQKSMIDKDMTVEELSNRVHRSRPFVSAIINGRQFSAPTVKIISDVLGVSDTDRTFN